MKKNKNIIQITIILFFLITGISNSFAMDESSPVFPIVTGIVMDQESRDMIKNTYSPVQRFDNSNIPPAPDYWNNECWAALPLRNDDADFAPKNTAYSENQKNALCDVFYIHPTGYTSKDFWNSPWDDKNAENLTAAMMICKASVFNAACKVYAPRYRQATFYSFFDDNDTSGIKAIEVAYGDVLNAFNYYIKYFNQGRPFILAGHSQGSLHAMRLLQDEIIGKPLQKKLVAAYIVGFSLTDNIQGIKASTSSTDTGTIIGWNTYTKNADPRVFTQDIVTYINGSYQKIKGQKLIEINPLSWLLNGPFVDASKNPGSLATGPSYSDFPLLVPGICSADASGNVLRINKITVSGFGGNDPKLPVMNEYYGDYHTYDYQLFYESIRKNVIDRVNAFINQ